MTNNGRPPLYSPELAKTICDRIIDGESLRGMCSEEGMPNISTIFLWLSDRDKGDFLDMYVSAKKLQADTFMEDALQIADYTERDSIIGKNGDIIIDGEWVARSRLRIETRMKIASKLAPRKYGEKSIIESETINTNLNVEVPLSEADLAILQRFQFDV